MDARTPFLEDALTLCRSDLRDDNGHDRMQARMMHFLLLAVFVSASPRPDRRTLPPSSAPSAGATPPLRYAVLHYPSGLSLAFLLRLLVGCGQGGQQKGPISIGDVYPKGREVGFRVGSSIIGSVSLRARTLLGEEDNKDDTERPPQIPLPHYVAIGGFHL